MLSKGSSKICLQKSVQGIISLDALSIWSWILFFIFIYYYIVVVVFDQIN